MNLDHKNAIEGDRVLQRTLGHKSDRAIPLSYFTKHPRSIRHLAWMGSDIPMVPFVHDMRAFRKRTHDNIVVNTISPVDFLAFRAHENEAQRALPPIYAMSAQQFYVDTKSGDLPFSSLEEAIVLITFEAKFQQDAACLVTLSPALSRRFQDYDLSDYKNSLEEVLNGIPILYPPSILDEHSHLRPTRKPPKVGANILARSPAKHVVPLIDEGRVVFSNDMRVAAVPPDIGRILKGSLWEAKTWDEVFESLAVHELPRQSARVFNAASKGDKMAWVFNYAGQRKTSAFVIISADVARSNLDYDQDGYISSVHVRESSTSIFEIMANVRTNFGEATYITLSSDTRRYDKGNGKRSILSTSLPERQRASIKNALGANTTPLTIQGRPYHLADCRPVDRRNTKPSDSIGGPASLVFNEAIQFTTHRSFTRGTSTSEIAMGYQAPLSQLVINQSDQVIIRAAGEEFVFEG